MKEPRVEDFDPERAKKLPDMGMESLPRIEKSIPISSAPPPASQAEEQQEKAQDFKKASFQERNQEFKKERFLDFLKPFLGMRSAGMVSFRYPQDLMDAMAEAQYQIRKRYKVKLTKNAILVAALAYMLWDFEQNGEESLLYTHMVKSHR
jgi:hypothetical protein